MVDTSIKPKPGDVVRWAESIENGGYGLREEMGEYSDGPFVVADIVDEWCRFTVRDPGGRVHWFMEQKYGQRVGFAGIWFIVDPFLTAVHKVREGVCTSK